MTSLTNSFTLRFQSTDSELQQVLTSGKVKLSLDVTKDITKNRKQVKLGNKSMVSYLMQW